MTAREFIYSTLLTIPSIDELGGLADPRIFAKKTMTSAYEQHPFIIFKLGVDSNLDISEDTRLTRQYFQIWCHDASEDDNSDYMRIDSILKEVKNVFKMAGSAEHKVFSTTFLETSQDFNDDTLNTIFKYSRFNLFKDDM